jgi:signal transduction histidine kinase
MNLLYEHTSLVLAVLFIVAVTTMVWHVFLLQSNLVGPRAPASTALSTSAFAQSWTLVTLAALWFGGLGLIIAKLRRTSLELEEGVTLRTKDLQEANIRLEVQIRERQQAEDEKKRLAAQVRRSQKMETIGTLAGGIAHDFNNILSAILGHTQLASTKITHDSSAQENLRYVLAAGRRGKDLVSQILAFSRQTEHERRPMHLGPAIEEVLSLLRATLPTTIEIKAELETKPATVLADPSQMHQVFANLCANAAHAMRDGGGTLEVRLEAIDITHERTQKLAPGPYLQVMIRDTGIGMEPAVLERIFDPFFTTKNAGEGTGMGLAVVHGIIASHGGTIKVDSSPGRGTAFVICLPRIGAPVAPNPLSTDQLQVGGVGGSKVLFVDDEQPLVEVGKELLELLGYDVEVRTSSVEALELFQAAPERFDVVITDQTMPNMTGEELSRRLLSIRSDLPIILCTGFSFAMTEERAKDAGVRSLLQKPLLGQDLAHALEGVLGSRAPVAS